jgi:hypothetical protein
MAALTMPPHAALDEAETDEESETEEEDIDQWLGADEVRRGRLEREADMVMKALSRRYGAGAERRGVILELARRELAKKSKYDAIHESRQRALDDAGPFGEDVLGSSWSLWKGTDSVALLVGGDFACCECRDSVNEFKTITSHAKEAVVQRPRWGQLGRDLASLAHALNEWCDLEVGPIDAIHVSTWAQFSDAVRATLGRGGRGAVAAIVVLEGGPYSVVNEQSMVGGPPRFRETRLEPGTLFVCTEHSFRMRDWRCDFLDKRPSTYACAVFRRVSAAPVQAENEARWWGPGGERHAMRLTEFREAFWEMPYSRLPSMDGAGFSLCRGILSRRILDAYRCHLRGIVGMQRTIGRGSAEPHRTLLRDEPGANELHRYLSHAISNHRMVQDFDRDTIEAKPSYCIVATYPRGASLPKHVDRPQCDFTMSVLVDYDGLADGDDAPWPLELDLPDGTTHAATWGAGDGLLYRGADLPHARGPLPAASATYLFFHWVLPSHKGRLR